MPLLLVLALVIPDAYATAMVPIIAAGVIALIAFLFRQNARSNEALATVAQQLKDMDRRTTRIEDSVFPPGGFVFVPRSAVPSV